MEIIPTPETPPVTAPRERLAYSIQEAADLLGVNYFSVYRLIQRGKLKVCRALRGKLLVPRTELLRLLKNRLISIRMSTSRPRFNTRLPTAK